MAAHKHGTMNITEQQKTFAGFMNWVVRVGAFCIAVVIFLAIFGS